MLLPIRDHNPSRKQPIVTWLLIAVNSALFIAHFSPEFANSPGNSSLDMAWFEWSLRPEFRQDGIAWTGYFSHMFLHADPLHLFGNMLMLYIFGDNLECRMGHFWFLLFYLACGLAGALTFVLFTDMTFVRVGGASGAVAGVMGGYLLLFPRAKIIILLLLPNIIWPISILIRMVSKLKIWGYFPILFFTFPLQAWVTLGIWITYNLLAANLDIFPKGTAYLVHIGGFAAGMLLVLPFLGKTRYHNDVSGVSEPAKTSNPWQTVDRQQIQETAPTHQNQRSSQSPWAKPRTDAPLSVSHAQDPASSLAIKKNRLPPASQSPWAEQISSDQKKQRVDRKENVQPVTRYRRKNN